MSSIAVAHEVDRMGGRAIACLNARDRNMLGFRRDLLTGAAYGVDEFLFVYGDDPVPGSRTGQLTVRAMIDYLRHFSDEQHGQRQPFRAGVTTRLTPLPAWKRRADFLFVQVAFSLDDLLTWRDTVQYDGSIYAGVMVLPSAAMARKLVETISQITVPRAWLETIERDPSSGVRLACELAQDIAVSGAFDGVRLIPGVRYRETAGLLGTSASDADPAVGMRSRVDKRCGAHRRESPYERAVSSPVRGRVGQRLGRASQCSRLRLMSTRLDSVATNPEGAANALRTAVANAQASPVDAYQSLYPSGRTLLKYLGPAFFTKFLYFAGRGVPTHPCAILDRVVAANLRGRGWDGSRSAGWSAVTYEQYCELLACWAREASNRLRRPVAVDEIELCLFDG